MNNPVAILGFVDMERQANAARKLKGFDLWGFNDPTPEYSPLKLARWFELHSLYKVDHDDPNEPKELRRLGIPIYMVAKHPTIPNSVAYPKDDILAHFKVRYFTNSVSWMLALAIYERRPIIHLYGIDMATREGAGPDEFGEQRPSIEWLLGWAMGAGIEVVLGEDSDLLKSDVLYGFEEHVDSAYVKASIRATAAQAKAQRTLNDYYFYKGAEEAYEVMGRTHQLTDEQ